MGQNHNPSKSHSSLAALSKNSLHEVLLTFFLLFHSTKVGTFPCYLPCLWAQSGTENAWATLTPQSLVGGETALFVCSFLWVQPAVGAEGKGLRGQQNKLWVLAGQQKDVKKQENKKVKPEVTAAPARLRAWVWVMLSEPAKDGICRSKPAKIHQFLVVLKMKTFQLNSVSWNLCEGIRAWGLFQPACLCGMFVGCFCGVFCGVSVGCPWGVLWGVFVRCLWVSVELSSSPWMPSGTGVLGLLSGFSGRAMLTSGGHICSSQPSLDLLSRLGWWEASRVLTQLLSFAGATGGHPDHREWQVPRQPGWDPLHSGPGCGWPGQIRVHSQEPLWLHLERHAAHHHRYRISLSLAPCKGVLCSVHSYTLSRELYKKWFLQLLCRQISWMESPSCESPHTSQLPLTVCSAELQLLPAKPKVLS